MQWSWAMSCEIASGPPGKVRSEPGKYSRPGSVHILSIVFSTHVYYFKTHNNYYWRLNTFWTYLDGHKCRECKSLLINNITLKPKFKYVMILTSLQFNFKLHQSTRCCIKDFVTVCLLHLFVAVVVPYLAFDILKWTWDVITVLIVFITTINRWRHKIY